MSVRKPTLTSIMLAMLSSASSAYRAPAVQSSMRRAACTTRRCLAVRADGGRSSAAVVQAEKSADDNGPAAARGAMDLNPPRGTRDFYPEDMALRNWLFGKWRDVANQHGFEEYDAPVLETEDLYIRKAGEDVTQQLYSLEDRSGRRLALRPEMTPSLARMVLGRKSALPMPLKVRPAPATHSRPATSHSHLLLSVYACARARASACARRSGSPSPSAGATSA